jgi:hypothetical protein
MIFELYCQWKRTHRSYIFPCKQGLGAKALSYLTLSFCRAGKTGKERKGKGQKYAGPRSQNDPAHPFNGDPRWCCLAVLVAQVMAFPFFWGGGRFLFPFLFFFVFLVAIPAAVTLIVSDMAERLKLAHARTPSGQTCLWKLRSARKQR